MMNRIERHGCRYSKLLTSVLALLALTILWPASALSQWTQPDASGNINTTNTGNVGIGTTTPQSKLQVGTLTSIATAAPDTLSLGGAQIHRPGMLIGKALEPLESGVGEILVLLSLQ